MSWSSWVETAGGYLTHAFPQPPWIVKGLIPGAGWTYLVSQAKVGKSIFAAQLAEALALGQPFLGFPAPEKPMRVAYLQADEPPSEWQAQLQQIGLDKTAHILMATDPEPWPLSTPLARGLIGNKLLMWQPDLLILDSQYALYAEDLNDIDAVVGFRKAIGSIWKGPYVLLHHPRKPPAGVIENFIDASAGSHTLAANASAILGLRPEKLVVAGGRLVKKAEYPLHRLANGRWAQGYPPAALLLPDDLWNTPTP
jgi:hypothetical protein